MKHLLSILLLFSFAAGAIALDFFQRNDLVLPRTLLGSTALSGLSREETREVVRRELTGFLEKPFQISAQGETAEVSLKELGVVLNETKLIGAVPFASDFSPASLALWSIAGQRVLPPVTVERTEVLRVLAEKFPNIPRAQNAYFFKNGKNILIAEAREGLTPNLPPLLHAIQQNIFFLENRPLTVEFQESPPTVSAADLEAHRDRILQIISKTITLTEGKNSWPVSFENFPQWVVFDEKNYEVGEGELPFTVQWDPLRFSEFTSEKLAKVLEQAPEDVRIFRDAEGKIQFDGKGNEGRAIQRERLLTLVNGALTGDTTEVEIPMEVVPPKVVVAADLQELGIHELVGVGHTRFAGSPANRQHNIGVGIARFSGILIAPGETFSFNEHLGRVDETTGYRKELVIKPEGTIPEFGGGLCQVSSTLYRAAIYAGLPIVERAAHSYAVTYYSQIGGHGLDATIYPPSRDLKFTNDTPSHLLIQSYVDGVDAYFKFYGTLDGRKVEMEGPYVSNRVAAPPEPVLVPDPKLPEGERKQVEKPHAGFETVWYRHVTKNGETIKETIKSKYKAMPAKFLVGGQTSSEGENKGLAETNPFE